MKKCGLLMAIVILVGWGCASQQVATPPSEATTQTGKQLRQGASEGLTPAEMKAREMARLKEEELARQRDIMAMAKALEEKDIHFDFDRYDLKSEARGILKELANFLLEHPGCRLVIEGHCDERGSEEYNLALGEKRANAATNYLISLGVSPKRITTISYGENRPLCQEHSEGCWWRNRRDHFILCFQ
jgi:peptidoglycan-associated lipoprotein